MAQPTSFQPYVSDREFDTVSATMVTAAKRMTNAQVLDLADALHDLIRSRQAVERTFARRQALRVS